MDEPYDQLLYRCGHCAVVFTGTRVKLGDGHLAVCDVMREGSFRIPQGGTIEEWTFHGCEGNVQGVAKLVGVKPGKAPETGGE